MRRGVTYLQKLLARSSRSAWQREGGMEAIQKVPNREGASSSMEEVPDWVITIEGQYKQLAFAGTLFELPMRRVPEGLAKHHPDPYTPRIVSFGPYHHGAARLVPMEQHKQQVLVQLLTMSGIRNPLRSCVEEVKKVEQKLRGYYEDLGKQWKEPNRFLEMMILDGIFMLAVLLMDKRQKDGLIDWIFRPRWGTYIMPMIRRDMLLLENQLPILLLRKLIEALRFEGSAPAIDKLILRFLGDLEVQVADERLLRDDEFGFHILDVYRRCKISEEYPLLGSQSMRWSATELDIAGVQFRMSPDESFNAIEFSSFSGTFRLPPIEIDDTSETLLLNLLAWEHHGHAAYVTCYVGFMVGLIRSSTDVALLRTKGIIWAPDSSDEDVVHLFKRVSKGVLAGIHILEGDEDIGAQVNDYCRKLRAVLLRTYASIREASPRIKVAALLYFAISIIQTVYTVLPYFTRNK